VFQRISFVVISDVIVCGQAVPVDSYFGEIFAELEMPFYAQWLWNV
jgi:hypothetical protein